MTQTSPFIQMQTALLRMIAPPIPTTLNGVYDGKSKLATLLGEDFLKLVRGKHVVDFGCGDGNETVEMIRCGAALVTGVEMPDVLVKTRKTLEEAGVMDRCRLTSNAEGSEADMVVSLDSFEHFADPEGILKLILQILRPGGTLHISFGWMWYHPTGSHLIELPPWSHVLFSEKAVLGWRALMRNDGAMTYEAVGLNRMTIARFERMIKASPFEMVSLKLVPIRAARMFHNRLTREFLTSTVRCVLRKPLK